MTNAAAITARPASLIRALRFPGLSTLHFLSFFIFVSWNTFSTCVWNCAMARRINDREAETQRRLPAFTVSAAARDNPLVRDMYDDEDDEDDGRGAPQVCPPSGSVKPCRAALPPCLR